MVLKTADGTVDGAGKVIGDADADHRNSAGYVLAGPELLTVFEGSTGKALDTVHYTPPRGNVASWGDGYGNRVDRFLAGTAYLDGQHPSLLVSRGYHTRTVVAAYDFDGTDLVRRWVFDSDVAGTQYAGQGNHELSVADLDPARPGLEVFAAHESMASSGGRGATYRDAATGRVLWSIPATRDTGRAAVGDIDAAHPGAEGWAVGGTAAWNSPVGELRSSSGELLSTSIPAANFLTWWDGDLLREIGDHAFDETARTGVPTISEWDPAAQRQVELYRATGTLSNNDTKGNPALQADLLGDWREELVTRTADPTAHRLRTLVSDPVYRLGVAWQNTAYNQPPAHLLLPRRGHEHPARPGDRADRHRPRTRPARARTGHRRAAQGAPEHRRRGEVGGVPRHRGGAAGAERPDGRPAGGRARGRPPRRRRRHPRRPEHHLRPHRRRARQARLHRRAHPPARHQHHPAPDGGRQGLTPLPANSGHRPGEVLPGRRPPRCPPPATPCGSSPLV
ncbi:rhamnogalacturonan lyase family protein [Kineococcus indalonis]|uniref:rhamnogalacturonan lyase family protein n=1 Tax=Kineococcus indalonis TaxID=2696566 RepID=UPI001F0F3FC3|nr:hypothetical protein [Kineococcus indalonis]